MNTKPYSAIRVLDLTHVLAGPFCTYLLALLGAETIKIEPPGEPDEVRGRGSDPALNAALMGTNYLTQGANKKAITLNLKSEEGREIFRKLAATADLIVENYRAGALELLGLGYDDIRKFNPKVIYCSMTGFGQMGKRATVNAYDNVIQAASGLMSVTGTTNVHPLKTGAPIVDYSSGLNAAFAISAALFRRERTGQGTRIDCSMINTAMFLMASQVTATRHSGPSTTPPRGNDQVESGLCCYETADGLLMLGAFNRRQHERLWLAFGKPDFAAHGSWEAMARHAPEMRQELAGLLKARTAAEWEIHFHSLGIPAERVRSLQEGIDIAQGSGQGLTTPVDVPGGEPVRVPAFPFYFSEGGPEITSPPPQFGQHNEAVLAELGYTADQIRDFKTRGIV